MILINDKVYVKLKTYELGNVKRFCDRVKTPGELPVLQVTLFIRRLVASLTSNKTTDGLNGFHN